MRIRSKVASRIVGPAGAMDRPSLALASDFATPLSGRIEVTRILSLRSLLRASRGVSASRMPVFTCPAAFSALYS